MRKSIMRRWSFVSILVISILLGLVLGSGVALAHDLFFTLSVGWNYLDGVHDESPAWKYTLYHWEWMNASKTRVDLDETRYWNGESDEYDPTFGILWVYDEYGYDTHDFWSFSGRRIRYCDYTANTDWTMDQLSSENDYAICQQLISYGAAMFSDYVVAWTNP